MRVKWERKKLFLYLVLVYKILHDTIWWITELKKKKEVAHKFGFLLTENF